MPSRVHCAARMQSRSLSDQRQLRSLERASLGTCIICSCLLALLHLTVCYVEPLAENLHSTTELLTVQLISLLLFAFMLPSSQVVVASVEDSLEVSCSRGVRLVADKLIGAATAADAGEYDMVALPVGGLVRVRVRVSVRARDRAGFGGRIGPSSDG
jgi:hypothetical protein